MKPPRFFKIDMVLAMVGYLFLWGPIIVLCIFAFNTSPFGVKWESLTLKWFRELFHTPALLQSVLRSLLIASVTTVVATIIGTIAGYGLYKYKFTGRRVLRISILLPITIPYVIMAGALLVYFTKIAHIPLGYLAIIIAHISFSAPLAVFVTLGRMQRIDWSLEEASTDLGADRLTTWRKITIPLLLPAIFASATLIFPWSFNDFTVTYFVAGVGTTTLPLYLYSMLQYSLKPVIINAISLIFIITPTILIFLISFLQRQKQA
ncbi:MAG: ABC transporter permease [Deltaproteobacteria bacterium]|nr:ABC transporter permease [Deltaproteobacteria bacterium]MBW2070063.1 ABC transporter permease [Deltaproteobacteria bacterium]